MSYTTTYINRVIDKREAFDNEAIPVSPAFYANLELVTAHHHDSGEVFKLDYSTAKGFIDKDDNSLYGFDDVTYVSSYITKPREEQEKFVEDYHNSTMRVIRERSDFIKELVSAL